MSDCNVCIGGEPDCFPEFWDSAIVTARKVHRCCECRREIPVGQKYERVSGKWDGEVETYKTCLVCVDIRDGLSCGNSTTYTCLWEEVVEGVFPRMTTSCFDKLTRADAKQYLLERWNRWKFAS